MLSDAPWPDGFLASWADAAAVLPVGRGGGGAGFHVFCWVGDLGFLGSGGFGLAVVGIFVCTGGFGAGGGFGDSVLGLRCARGRGGGGPLGFHSARGLGLGGGGRTDAAVGRTSSGSASVEEGTADGTGDVGTGGLACGDCPTMPVTSGGGELLGNGGGEAAESAESISGISGITGGAESEVVLARGARGTIVGLELARR